MGRSPPEMAEGWRMGGKRGGGGAAAAAVVVVEGGGEGRRNAVDPTR